MGTPNMTMRDEAEIVKMFLPDHTLDPDGKVVKDETDICLGCDLPECTPKVGDCLLTRSED
ncbi:MAG: hypothetical protein KKD44_26930 [Proteobacteria bacterium]|nr:hypothetical protein [Pseudomonadota bacterium]